MPAGGELPRALGLEPKLFEVRSERLFKAVHCTDDRVLETRPCVFTRSNAGSFLSVANAASAFALQTLPAQRRAKGGFNFSAMLDQLVKDCFVFPVSVFASVYVEFGATPV